MKKEIREYRETSKEVHYDCSYREFKEEWKKIKKESQICFIHQYFWNDNNILIEARKYNGYFTDPDVRRLPIFFHIKSKKRISKNIIKGLNNTISKLYFRGKKQ